MAGFERLNALFIKKWHCNISEYSIFSLLGLLQNGYKAKALKKKKPSLMLHFIFIFLFYLEKQEMRVKMGPLGDDFIKAV